MATVPPPMARDTLKAYRSAGASNKKAQAAASEIGAIQATLEKVLERVKGLDWKQNVIIGVLAILTTIVVGGFGLVISLLFQVLAGQGGQ